MNTTKLIAVSFVVFLASCTGTSHNSANSTANVSSTGETQAETSILSQDECDRQAATGITAANCDAEFDKLAREIDADPTAGG
jgi:hypothetical protein